MSAPAMLSSFEQSFAQALLEPGQPVPQCLAAHNAQSATRRFAVYRNNVVAGLVKAIEARFPAVEKIVGEDFFVAMARIFVVERPPRSPLLATYGDEFADFISTFEPARELTYRSFRTSHCHHLGDEFRRAKAGADRDLERGGRAHHSTVS